MIFRGTLFIVDHDSISYSMAKVVDYSYNKKCVRGLYRSVQADSIQMLEKALKSAIDEDIIYDLACATRHVIVSSQKDDRCPTEAMSKLDLVNVTTSVDGDVDLSLHEEMILLATKVESHYLKEIKSYVLEESLGGLLSTAIHTNMTAETEKSRDMSELKRLLEKYPDIKAAL